MTEQQRQFIGDGTLSIGDTSKTDFMVKVKIHKHNKNSQYLGIWMDLETVIPSEVRKRKTNVGFLTYTCGIWKNVIDNLICKAEIETQM